MSSANKETGPATDRCTHIGSVCSCSKYRILGVPMTVSPQGLKDAMKKLSLEWHPDRSGTAAWKAAHPGVSVDECSEEFKRIRRAFESLEPLVGARRGVAEHRSLRFPLIDACKSADVNAVKEIVSSFGPQSAELHALDEGGMDALGWACRLGHQDIVRVLLEYCADHDAPQTNTSPTPLEPGCDSQITTTALAVEAVPALWAAAAGGDADIVSMLLTPERQQTITKSSDAIKASINEKETLLGERMRGHHRSTDFPSTFHAADLVRVVHYLLYCHFHSQGIRACTPPQTVGMRRLYPISLVPRPM